MHHLFLKFIKRGLVFNNEFVFDSEPVFELFFIFLEVSRISVLGLWGFKRDTNEPRLALELHRRFSLEVARHPRLQRCFGLHLAVDH